MKKITLFLVFLTLMPIMLFADLQLTTQEKAWLQNHPIITVSNEDDWPPFDFSIDGKAEGYSIDVIKLLAKNIGIKIKFINGYSWSELIQEFDKGNIDLMHSMSISVKREKKYSFSKPYMPWRLAYFTRDEISTDSLAKDFAGKKIAAGKGWSSTILLKSMYPKAIIIEYKNTLEMIDALATSKVDLAIDNIHAVEYILSENIITNIIHGGYIKLKNQEDNSLHFVSHKDSPELVSIFSKAYSALDLNDKLALQKKWFRVSTNIKLNSEEQKYLDNKQFISMCIDPNWMPYEKFDADGKHVGMTADFYKLFQKELGIAFKTVKTKNWSESLEAAKQRECDIFSLAMETPERKKYMNFTSPFLSIPLVLATRLDVAFFDDLNYLKDKKIGIVKGYAFNELIRKKYPNFQVVDVDNLKKGLQSVANGELFGCIGTMASIGYMFQTDFVGELKIAGKFDEKWELGIGVRNDDPLLFGILEKTIQHISQKDRNTIFSKYIAVKYERKMDYTLLFQILGAVLVIMLIGVYHNQKLSRMNKKLKVLQKKLQIQANNDPMTNLYNRRYFHDIADQLFEIAKREKHGIGIIMIDIDNFKLVNDTYGHNIGDNVIKNLANLLSMHTRASDIVTRFGGEEFVILLPNTNLVGTQRIASKIRSIVETYVIELDNEKTLQFTISLGITTVLQQDTDIEDALKRSDKALYEAKESGKNKVCIQQTN